MDIKDSHKNFAEFDRRYREELRPLYREFASRLHVLLEELINKAGIPIDHIEHRIKTVESFIRKIKKKGYYHDPFGKIKDFVGIRIITYYPDDVNKLTEIIHQQFAVDEGHSGDKIHDLDQDEFGYRSVHLILSLSEERAKLDEWQRFAGLCAEVQLRSILQHAWAVLSHEMHYKGSVHLPSELQRRLFRLSAQLESADEEFTTLRDLLAKVIQEDGSIINSTREPLTLNLDSLQEFMEQNVDLQKWAKIGIQAGMEPLQKPIKKFHPYGLENLLHILRVVEISTIIEFEKVLSDLEPMTEHLRYFVDLVKSKEKVVYAVPVDVLILLISFSKAPSIPPDFDWGGKYESFFIETLWEALPKTS